MRALVVANPAATTTNRRVRDVLLGALSSELKVDLAETAHRGHGRELGQQALAEGGDVVVALGGGGPGHEVAEGPLTDGPGAARRDRRGRAGSRGASRAAPPPPGARPGRRGPSSPVGPPTSSPARSAAPATRSRRPARSSTPCGRAGPAGSPSAPRSEERR